MNNEPFYVDVLLPGTMASGYSREVDPRRRIADVLNGAGETFKLSAVRITDWAGTVLALLPDLLIEKRNIVAVIPQETDEYLRSRRLQTLGSEKRSMVAHSVVAVMESIIAKGTAFRSYVAGADEIRLAMFARFFPLTSAKVQLLPGRTLDADVLILHRDLLVGITAGLASIPDARDGSGWRIKVP